MMKTIEIKEELVEEWGGQFVSRVSCLQGESPPVLSGARVFEDMEAFQALFNDYRSLVMWIEELFKTNWPEGMDTIWAIAWMI